MKTSIQTPSSPFTRDNLRRVFGGRLPGQLVIQYTDRCNASCIQCGMRRQNDFPRSVMAPDTARRILDAAAEQGIQAVSFTGGEPLLCLDDLIPLIRHAGDAGIRWIRTGTNGFIFRGHEKPGFADRMHRIAERLAETPLNTFWISLDSASAAVHEANRGLPGMVEGIRLALPIFHEHGLYPAANLGINRYTGGDGQHALPSSSEPFEAEDFQARARTAFRRFYATVLDLGFTMVNACYPMSCGDSENTADDAVYAAASSDDFISFRPEEKIALFRALHETIPEFRDQLRIFTPRSSLRALIRQYEGKGEGHPCRGGVDFFFVDARDGNTYPCGYRGSENLGSFWNMKIDELPNRPDCRRCDWECFRDPSELAGPLLDAFGGGGLRVTSLLRTVSRTLKDREMFRDWWEDLRYYRACDFFSARTAPDWRRLAGFVSPV